MEIKHFSFFLMLLIFCSCDKLKPDLDEEYTISGHIYEGFGESPLANQEVYLEGYRSKGFGGSGEFTNLGSAVTDSEGYFSITYEQQFSSSPALGSGAYVELRTSETASGGLISFPWNVNFDRSVARINHSKIHFEVSISPSVSSADTLYMLLDLIQGDSVEVIEIPPFGEFRCIVVPLTNSESMSFALNVISGLGSDWENSPRFIGTRYGIGLNELLKSVEVGADPSTPDDYNLLEGEVRGFPFTDTIKLIL